MPTSVQTADLTRPSIVRDAAIRSGDSANLDYLRAMAVLCVFVGHLVHIAGGPNWGSLGRFGVVLFFVHTSCVLMASLDRTAPGRGYRQIIHAFAVRRFFRIYPLSAAAVLLAIALRIPPYGSTHYEWIGWRDLLSNLAITQSLTYSRLSLGVLWSLPLEVQMYCLLPFLYLAIRSRRFASLGLLVLSVVAALTIPRVTGRLIVFAYAPCFTAGVLAYDLARRVKPRLPAWLWPLALFAAIAAFGPLDNISLYDKMPRTWLVSALVGCAIPWFRELRWIPLRRLAHWVAKYSYGIYLAHTMVFWLAFEKMAGLPLAARLAVLVIGSVASPVAMYYGIEDPMIRFGKRFTSRILARPQSRTAHA